MYRRILAPVDGSEASDAGLREAVALARDQKAELRIVHVLDQYALATEMVTAADYQSLHAELQAQGEAVLARARQLAKKRSVPCETLLRESTERRVAETIVTEALAWPCDLIVMGTHGRRGLHHAVLGSSAEAVLRHSPVPVLLVRLRSA
jgi:nucleotide-binding universal stress UspA family protein